MKKRPWPVWLIAAFVLYSVGSYFILVASVYLELAPSSVATAVTSMGGGAQIIGAAQMLVYGAAAVLLFLLSRHAVLAFLASLAFGVVMIGVNLLTQPQYLAVAQQTHFVPIIIGQLLKVIALVYSFWLRRKKVLT